MTGSINGSMAIDVLGPARAGAERGGETRVDRGGVEDTGRAARTEGVASTGESVSRAVDKVRDFVQIARRNLEFSIDEDTGRTIVRVLDAESGELVRQIPPEEILSIAENLEAASGLLFSGRA